MSSATGLKTTDGQRLSARMAALCGASTPAISAAGRWPTPPLRAALAQTFALMAMGHKGDAQARDVSIDTPDGAQIGARLYEPADLPASPGLIVYFHGGGWVFGDLTSHDSACRFLARRAAAKVLAVDYRLAPEHPFPTAVEDALAGLRHAGAHADELGIDPERIAVAGDSAGGNLAASVALHRSGDDPHVRFATLIYPVTDADVDAYSSARLFARGPLLTRQAVRDMVGHYAPSPQQRLDPRLSVIRADNLDAMAPTFLATAGMDPLRDQGEAFAEKLRAAGVEVESRRFGDLPHGFFSLLVEPDARRAAEAIASATARALQRRGAPAPVG